MQWVVSRAVQRDKKEVLKWKYIFASISNGNFDEKSEWANPRSICDTWILVEHVRVCLPLHSKSSRIDQGGLEAVKDHISEVWQSMRQPLRLHAGLCAVMEGLDQSACIAIVNYCIKQSSCNVKLQAQNMQSIRNANLQQYRLCCTVHCMCWAWCIT